MFQRNPDDFLHRFTIVNETWIYHYTPDTKEQSKKWISPAPRKASRVVGSVILIDYLQKKR